MSREGMALRNDDILANVCEFVGKGHFYFVAKINSRCLQTLFANNNKQYSDSIVACYDSGEYYRI